jgi:hypothetical protein
MGRAAGGGANAAGGSDGDAGAAGVVVPSTALIVGMVG